MKNAKLVKIGKIGDGICILDYLNSSFIMHNSQSSAEGCYSHYDCVKGDWVRSGKVTGRPASKQISNYVKRAKSKQKSNNNSKFFTLHFMNNFGK